MSVREFDGTDDYINVGTGAIGNFTFGSLWVLAYAPSWALGSTKHILSFRNTVPENSWTLGVNSSGVLRLVNSAGANVQGSTALVDGRWYIIGVSKATGTATPRFHWWSSAGGWGHENGGATTPDNADTHAGIAIGANHSGTAGVTNIRIAAAAVRKGLAMSDANFETLEDGVVRWFEHSPQALWLTTQDTVSQAVQDLTGGGANETAVTGTAVVADVPPVPLLVPVRYRRRAA